MATILMNANKPVLKFDLDEGIYEVLDTTQLPYALKGKLREVPEYRLVRQNMNSIKWL